MLLLLRDHYSESYRHVQQFTPSTADAIFPYSIRLWFSETNRNISPSAWINSGVIWLLSSTLYLFNF
jgi:hypothetical protein